MADEYFSSTHPLLPPTSEDDRVLWLRLLRSRRVGISTFYRLMSEYGSAQNALAQLPQIAQEAGVDNYQSFSEAAALAEMKAGAKFGARLIFKGEASYPKSLYDLGDAPPMLWVKGNIDLLTRQSVAMVGARNASSLGTRMAKYLAQDMGAHNWIIISGLARGIDAAAHSASLSTGTIAVLGGGVDVFYPTENRQLAEAIAEKGLLISEQPMGLQPMARHFPMRNRLISGLAKGVIVIEAASKSGSLITAKNALDQGRDVLVVPGHPFDARSSGCNMLLRDGATLVRNAEDVIEALSSQMQYAMDIPEPPAEPKRSLRETAQLHQKILDKLSTSGLPEDQLIRDLKTSAPQISPVILDLELAGKIERQAGGLLARTT